MTKLGITEIDIRSKMSIVVYIHYPGQFMSIDTNSKVFSKINNTYFIDMDYSIIENTPNEKSDLPCSHDMDFKLDDCIYNVSILTNLQ